MIPATPTARTTEMTIDDRNGYRRAKLRNDGEVEGGDDFSSGIDGGSSRSPWVGKEA